MLIIGKISGINTNDGMINVLVNDGKGATYNLKTDQETGKKFSISDVYEFDVEVKEGERTQYFLLSYRSIMEFSFEEKNKSLRDFYVSAPYGKWVFVMTYVETPREIYPHVTGLRIQKVGLKP